MKIDRNRIAYTQVAAPPTFKTPVPVQLTDETMQQRRQKLLNRMEKKNLDILLVYADREHGGNFSYLTGFAPRFEEALLILHKNGEAYAMLGNEMLRMAAYSRIPVTAIHTPHFSLPNQPMETKKSFQELLEEAGICPGRRVGIAGWKLLRDRYAQEEQFDVPWFIVQGVMQLAGKEGTVNAAGLFIDPADGARITVNANEIAFYEYGAALASSGVAKLLNHLETGKTELELAGYLEQHGQPNTVQTICATGERFIGAVVSPRNKKTSLGDRFSATVGYRGGLTNRSGYLAVSEEDLPLEEREYLGKVAIPYVQAMASWYASVGIQVKASEIYHLIEEVVPKETYGWSLNPGHYTADEEWLSSPFTADSDAVLRPGMLLQMDIILKVPGYGGCNAEDGIALMDQMLQNQVKTEYPKVWERFVQRQTYVREVLGIPLRGEVFPMSDLCGYVRPFLLNRQKAFVINPE